MVIDTGSLLFQLVCEAILSSARELGFEEDEMIDIALVHVAHSRIQSRLRCFSKLVQAKPEVMEKLKEVPVFREKQDEVVSWLVRLSTRPLLSVTELGDEDVKNNWLCKQTTALKVHHGFDLFLWLPGHDYYVKLPNGTSYKISRDTGIP